MSMLDIAAAARHIRETLGLKQTEMADMLGVTNAYISNIETGDHHPSWKLIQRYHEVTGVDPHVLAWCKREMVAARFPKEAAGLRGLMCLALLNKREKGA